jgi:hypothetical protein
MVVLETDFSFKISLVCSSKWIHEITYSLFKKFWRQVCEVPKTKKHTICKNDMFYVYGIFSTNGLKKLKHTGTFTCIFDRHAKTSATDARRYVGWGATFSKVP